MRSFSGLAHQARCCRARLSQKPFTTVPFPYQAISYLPSTQSQTQLTTWEPEAFKTNPISDIDMLEPSCHHLIWLYRESVWRIDHHLSIPRRSWFISIMNEWFEKLEERNNLVLLSSRGDWTPVSYGPKCDSILSWISGAILHTVLLAFGMATTRGHIEVWTGD